MLEPISRMHPNGESIQSSDLPIIISPYDTPATSPTATPFTATLMSPAASYYSTTTRHFCLDPSIITLHRIFISESLIKCIPVICECIGVGHDHEDNAHLNIYVCLHGIEKVGMDIFIYQKQLRFYLYRQLKMHESAWSRICPTTCGASFRLL